jgi:hypothetical protein
LDLSGGSRGREHLLGQQHRQPTRVEPVRRRASPFPLSAIAWPGSASWTMNPSRCSSRKAQRQPLVASIATAARFPCHSIAQCREGRSRVAGKRASTTSPESASHTAARSARGERVREATVTVQLAAAPARS